MRKNKNQRKNKKKIILISLLVLLLVLCIVLIKILSKTENKVYAEPTPVNTEGWMGYKNSAADAYHGSKDALEINTRIKQVFEVYIPVIGEELKELNTSDKISDYYESKTEYINNRLCIKDKTEFEKFVTKLLELDCDLSKLNYCVYAEDSYKVLKDYESITFSIYYTEDKLISLDALIYDDFNLNLELRVH